MAAIARAAAMARPAVAPVVRDRVDELARWLLVAMGLDLLVTRFVVRLAIFVPKGEPWATVAAGVGRIGATTDALVPIVGLLVLGALLLRAGRLGGRAERAILVTLTTVAAGGLALVAFPPTPGVAIVLNLLVVATALGSAIRLVGDTRTPAMARIGLVSLAGAFALGALGRAVDLVGVLIGSGEGWPDASVGLTAEALGQMGFVAGVGLVGLGGVVSLWLSGLPVARPAAIGVIAAMVVLVAGAGAPATWGALAIWSLGLAGTVPTPAVALAVGGSIVLLSGYGLAASGLVLGGLLGLVVARSHEAAGPEPV